MNLDPKNYVALLDSIIRTNPSLLDTIRTILKAYLKLDPYDDLLGQMDAKLQSTLLYIIQDINEIENPFTLEQEVYFLLEHLNQVDAELNGIGVAYDNDDHDDNDSDEAGGDAAIMKPKDKKTGKKKAPVKGKAAAKKSATKKKASTKKKTVTKKKTAAVKKGKPAAKKKALGKTKKKAAAKPAKKKAAVKAKSKVKTKAVKKTAKKAAGKPAKKASAKKPAQKVAKKNK